MSDSIDRIRARVEAHTAAAAPPPPPPNTPAEPVAPPASDGDIAAQVADLQQAVLELRGDVDGLIEAAVDDAMSEMGAMEMDEPAVAAVAAPSEPAGE